MIILFAIFASEDGKQLSSRLYVAIFKFYAEKCAKDAEGAEVGKLCGSAPPHPVRYPEKEKIRTSMIFEPVTSAIPMRCSTNELWSHTLEVRSIYWVHIFCEIWDLRPTQRTRQGQIFFHFFQPWCFSVEAEFGLVYDDLICVKINAKNLSPYLSRCELFEDKALHFHVKSADGEHTLFSKSYASQTCCLGIFFFLRNQHTKFKFSIHNTRTLQNEFMRALKCLVDKQEIT